MCSDIPGDRHMSMQDRHFASQQPSFAPNEFVYRWLSRTNSSPPEDEREQPHHDLDAISPAHYEHVERCRNKIEQRNIPQLPTEKPARAHKSVVHHKPHDNRAKKVAVPQSSCLPQANHQTDEEKSLGHRHSRKRLRPGRGILEADDEDSHGRSVLREFNVIRSRSSSSHSRFSNGSQGAALPVTRVAAVGRCPENQYERRPRHKTRPDKYELKVDKRTVEKSSHERTHNSSKRKRKRRKKTGLALNHDFKAPNVPQDRLTLKPNAGPGIFHRGKASAPVERRGLPDLTFSEMNFLTKRRVADDTRDQRSKDVQPPKKSNKGSAQEISDFFSRPGQHDVGLQRPTAKSFSQHHVSTNQSISPNKSSPATRGVRKPLSIISGNETGARAFSTNGLGTAPQPEGWAPEPHVPAVQRYHPAKRESFVKRNQSKSTKSYYLWSATPSQKASLYADLHGHSGARQLVAREPNYEPRPPSPRRRDLPKITRRLPDQSSISDRSLEHYAKHILLGEDKQGIRGCVPRSNGQGGHYTLGDLKRLARLSELDEVNQSSAVQFDQYRDAKAWGTIFTSLTNLDEHKHTLPAQTSSGEGLEAPAARPRISIPRKPIHRNKGAECVNEASADPAARGPEVAQSGRQGLYAAGPADNFSFRDSTGLGDTRLTPEQVAWLLNTDSQAREVRNWGTIYDNAVQSSNHLPVPLWRTFNSVHRLGLQHGYAEPDMKACYSESPLNARARIQEPIGHSEPDTKLDHMQIPHKGHQHDHLAIHGTTGDFYHLGSNSALSDGHDDFDRGLLCGPVTFLDDTANILDDFEAAQLDPAFLDPVTGLSDVSPDLASAHVEPTAAARDQNRSIIDIGPKHSEDEVAASRPGIDGLLRNQTWERKLGRGGGCGEVENEFTGFARPHILY